MIYMKNKWIVLTCLIVIIVALGFFAYKWFNNLNTPNDNNGSSYQATKTLAEYQNHINTTIEPAIVESELYTFSTPIKTSDDNRLNNIKITCSRINNTIVKQNKVFSFCDIVGKPTSEDGYKPADAFGKDNKIIKAIGGGNCQVSTTVYNAALGVKGLKITERHEHDRDVAYIKDGKDATVAYDYLDLKFKNTNNFDIKLYAYVKDKKVYVKINKLS